MLDREVKSLEGELIAWRRHMHEHPELSFEEYETTEYIEKLLRSFGNIKIERPTKTGLVARIFGTKELGLGEKPRVLGIRADIDALPMAEEAELPFASKCPGVMHSCGHDGHAAMLLATAKLLSKSRDTFSGEARLIFQHAEELPPGGALELIRAGAAEGVDFMLGLHLSSNYDSCVFGIRSGALTAAVDRFDITVKGRGGHCAFPDQCIDPIVIISEIVLALQSVVSRKVSPTDSAVISVCKLNAGTAYNIIPSEATLTAAVRTFRAETRSMIEREVTRVARGIAESHGAQCEVSYERGYPTVVNDERLTALAENMIAARFGAEHGERIDPIMPGEDFAYFLDGTPGFFAELGTRNAAIAADRPHHNPYYKMDEAALAYGVQFELDMTRKLLSNS